MYKLLVKVIFKVILSITSRYDLSEPNILINGYCFLSGGRLLVFLKYIVLPLIMPLLIIVIVDNVGFILLLK